MVATCTAAVSMSSLSVSCLSGDGDAMIVDSGLVNCDAAGDLEMTSARRDDTELTVCRLTMNNQPTLTDLVTVNDRCCDVVLES